MKKVWLVACALILLSVSGGVSSAAPPPPWWDAAYSSRTPIAVTVPNAVGVGYSLNVTINHASLVASGLSLSSGNDVRVVRYDGFSWTELDRVLAITSPTASTWNSATTKIFFRTPVAIAAGSVDSSFYLYFGNSAAGAPPANANNVYDVFDDFEDPAFNGSVDPLKWTIVPTAGATVQQTSGVLRLSGTWGTERAGIQMKRAVTSNLAAESTVSRPSSSGLHLQVYSGLEFNQLAAYGNPPGTVAFFSGGWNNITPSSLNGTTWGPVRVASSVSADSVVKWAENGTLLATRTASSNTMPGHFLYSPAASGRTSTVEFDNVIIRQFVAIEPTAVLGTPESTKFRVNIEPVLTFSIAGQATACNGATPVFGTSSSTALNFGRPAIGTNSVVAQTLAGGSNAGVGTSVRISGTPLASGPADIDGVVGTNATPAAFGTGEGFGYTSNAVNLPGGTATRFSGVNKWAAVTSTPSPVAFGLPGPTSIGACVAFQTGVAATTISGAYSGTLTYQVVPTY